MRKVRYLAVGHKARPVGARIRTLTVLGFKPKSERRASLSCV